MGTTFLWLLNLLFSVYSLAIVLRAFLPWVGMTTNHPVMRFLVSITEPLLAPIRRFMPPLGNIDFSPMVALALLWVVEAIVRAIAAALF